MGSRIPFTPSHASVNRVRIVDLPGLPIDDEVRGRLTSELISLAAIRRYAGEQALALQLPETYAEETAQTRIELPYFLARCLTGPDPRAREAAQAIADRLGRNLAHFLATLHRGDAINRAARIDWTAADWKRWQTVERVWLTGGLIRDPLGPIILESARALLSQWGYLDRPAVVRTPYGQHTVLLGAGRYLPAPVETALALDCGHTQIKRGCLHLKEGTLERVEVFESLPVPWNLRDLPREKDPALGRQVCDRVADAVARTWEECRAAGHTPAPELVMGIAAYIQGGRLLGNGLYVHLNAVAPDARHLLAEAIHARTGQRFHVRLIHDGTAAASLHAGEPHSAVIVMGTALGIGFPPLRADQLRLLSPAIGIP